VASAASGGAAAGGASLSAFFFKSLLNELDLRLSTENTTSSKRFRSERSFFFFDDWFVSSRAGFRGK
jgi:hypothetical protein